MPTTRRRAMALLMFAPGENAADKATSRADARIALCLACGVPPAEIDPGMGYRIAENAYREVRRSHVRHMAENPGSAYARRYAREAHARWRELRPDLACGDDWFTNEEE